MKEANASFFKKIQASLDSELAGRVSECVRYIATDDEEKTWLQHVRIKYSHRFSKNRYALLLVLGEEEYLCLININPCVGKLPEVLEEIPVNAGLATALGSEGLLTPKVNRILQEEIYDKVLYDSDSSTEKYQWKDIERYFPSIYCYQINMDDDIDIRENINAFYWVLTQVAIEFDMGNNPFSDISMNTWGKIIYEKELSSIQYKNLLLAYTALSWDISYLYLYQCLEDKFSYEAVQMLHSKLNIGITPIELSHMLYDELSWQPKDLDGIESIIRQCPQESVGIQYLKALRESEDQALEKYIYKLRNRIVHETRESLIPLEDNESWEKAITGMLYLIKDS